MYAWGGVEGELRENAEWLGEDPGFGGSYEKCPKNNCGRSCTILWIH